MNRYPEQEQEQEQDSEASEATLDMLDEDSASEPDEMLTQPASGQAGCHRPDRRALQIRRAIEWHRERVALRALIDDWGDEPGDERDAEQQDRAHH